MLIALEVTNVLGSYQGSATRERVLRTTSDQITESSEERLFDAKWHCVDGFISALI